jgi:hypothetical protein
MDANYLQDPQDGPAGPGDASYFSDVRGAAQDPNAPQGPVGGPQTPLTGVPNTYGGGFTNSTSPGQMLSQNRMNIQGQGNAINQEAMDAINRYGSLEEAYRQTGDQKFADLAKTPGYNADEAAKIGTDYNQLKTSPQSLQDRFLNSGEQAGIRGNPNDPRNTMNAGVDAEGKQLNSFGENLGGQLSNLSAGEGGQLAKYESNVGSQAGKLESNVGGQLANEQRNVTGAVGGLSSGLTAAQGKFGKLDTAVNDPALNFDPNATEKQYTDQDVQDEINAAGRSVGVKTQAEKDDIERRAAAQGNSSPAAIAAMQQRQDLQGGVQGADAETDARIAAKQAQYERAAGIEGQREGAVKTQTGFKAGAATTEEQQAQAAAGLAGTTDVNANLNLGHEGVAAGENVGAQTIGAAEDVGKAGVGVAQDVGHAGVAGAEDYGHTAVNEASDAAGKTYQAANTAEQNAAAREQFLGQNRQATTGDVQNTQFGQGMTTAGANSTGAQTLGNARIAGETAVRNYNTGQQAAATQAGQAARTNQVQNFGVQSGGVNQAAGAQVQNMATGTSPATYLGAIFGSGGAGGTAGTAASFFEDGGIVTKPTVGVVAEHRPEMVVPLRKVRRYMPQGRPA